MARPIKGKLPLPVFNEIIIVVLPGFRQFNLCFIESVYIALVVLVVMNNHRLLVNVRLQRIISIRERGQCVPADRDRP